MQSVNADPQLDQVLSPLTNREQEKVYAPDELWTDAFACKVAVQDFNAAESYRTQNCDWRWRTADELYQSWVQQKYWEGTRIPRASIGVFVAFEQIESMLPKIMQAIFGDNPWFEADPLPGTTAEQARQWREHLADQLDKTRVREILRRAIKSGLLYGNGIVKLSWILRKYDKPEWVPRMRMKTEASGDPLMGGSPQFSGIERVLDKRTAKIIENRPQLEYVSIKDFYVDPNCASPQVQDGRYCVERKLCTVDDIESLRDHKEFKLPSKSDLLEMARQKPAAQADNTKSMAELFRLGNWWPATDQTVDPGGKRLEILEYTTADRVVWVANRQTAILNIPNSYGFIPYYDAFYADVLDRFYCMSVADVVEGEQRLQSSVLNARLDELSLSIHRPVLKKKGLQTPQYMLRTRPGQIIEVEDPKNDYQLMQTEGSTQNAFMEVAASENRVQKITGVTDLAVLGVPSSQGNSASRTATGVGVQAQASASRLQYLVENLEDTFLEPMLNDLVTLNQMFPPIGSPAGESIAMTRVRLTMRASAKMQSKMALLQVYPLVSQSLMNPAFMQQLAQQGETIDFPELIRMLLDTTGYRRRADLIRKMTPEEQQAMQKQQQSEESIKLQMQRERIAGQKDITQLKLASENEREQREMDNEGEQDQAYIMAELAKALIAAKASEEKRDRRPEK